MKHALFLVAALALAGCKKDGAAASTGGTWTDKAKAGADLYATIQTNQGAITVKLFSKDAPKTVANFVGLATGEREWRSPATGETKRNVPLYNGTIFHRVIEGFMIQGGDPTGSGTGTPGYFIPDEVWDGAHHDQIGLICMANRGPNTNGAQFFIMDGVAKHLDGGYTIFGDCTPVETVHDIANVPTGDRDRPLTPVNIKTITISREKAK